MQELQTEHTPCGGRRAGWMRYRNLVLAACAVVGWAWGAAGCDTRRSGEQSAAADSGGSVDGALADGGSVDPDSEQQSGRDTAPDTADAPDGGRPGDTTGDADGSSDPPDPESEFERETNLPVDCDSSDSEVEIIGPETYDDPDNFQDALNNDNKRIFCLKPGDYRDLSGKWGIFLKTAGTQSKRRYLVYHNPSMPEDRHPWNMDDPSKKTGDERVLLPSVRVREPYWTLDRLRFDSEDGGVKVKGAHHVVVNRSMFHKMPGDPDVQAVGLEDAHHVWVQNSVFGDFPQWDVGDDVCCGFEVGSGGDDNLALLVVDSDHVYFVDNEAWDPFNGDIVQTQAVNTQQDRIVRTVIADNDMWLTDDMYDEPYENAIDFKKGPDNGPKSEWAVIQNNRIWNFANQSNLMSWSVITTHGQSNTTGFLIRDNVFWDNKAPAIGISTTDSRSIIEGNLIHNQKVQTAVGGKGGIVMSASGESRVAHNIFVDSETDEFWHSDSNDPHDVTVEQNVFIDSDIGVPQHEPSNTVRKNAFYGSTPFQGDNPDSIIRSSAGDAKHAERTVRVREITGPETIRLPRARVTEQSPHARWFSD